jgi:hypothetical protein
LYTPASSAVEISTSRRGSCCGGNIANACPNTMGLIFEAQPAQATWLVSRHCFSFNRIGFPFVLRAANKCSLSDRLIGARCFQKFFIISGT